MGVSKRAGALRFLALCGVLTGAALFATRWWGLSLGPKHSARVPAAEFSPHLEQAIARQEPGVHDGAGAQDAALALTASLLDFGLGHRTSLHFDTARRGNCVEYAELFAAIFNRLARNANLRERALVLRSRPALVFGVGFDHPAWRDHDYVMIVNGPTARAIDPLLYDYWLGADVTYNVRGPLPVPPVQLGRRR